MEKLLQSGRATGEYGPQELVTTTEGAVYFLQGGEWEVAMTPLKSGHPPCSHGLGWSSNWTASLMSQSL